MIMQQNFRMIHTFEIILYSIDCNVLSHTGTTQRQRRQHQQALQECRPDWHWGAVTTHPPRHTQLPWSFKVYLYTTYQIHIYNCNDLQLATVMLWCNCNASKVQVFSIYSSVLGNWQNYFQSYDAFENVRLPWWSDSRTYGSHQTSLQTHIIFATWSILVCFAGICSVMQCNASKVHITALHVHT